MSFSTDEAEASPAPTTGATGVGQAGNAGTEPAAGGGTGLEGIGGEDVRATRHPMHEPIWAVQQIYALRNRRVEFQPTLGVSLNDPYVSHPAFGLGMNYWVSNVLAAGVNFIWFQGFNGRTDLDFHLSRGTRAMTQLANGIATSGLAVPVNEYQLAAALNFTYVPVYGKFLMFNRFIFHWDMYVNAGVGIIRTRPVPVIDPEVRRFDFNNQVLIGAGVGVRVFINRWLGIVGEVRNYVYVEQLETLTIAATDRPVTGTQMPTPDSRQDPSRWRTGTSLTDNVMIQVGLTIFLPFQVTYRLQK